MIKTVAIFFVLIFTFFFSAQAQQSNTQESKGPFTLQEQFYTIKNRSAFRPDDHSFKMVRITRLDTFWKNVQDSLKAQEKAIRQEGKATAQALQQSQKTVTELKSQLQSVQAENIQKEKQIQKTVHDIESLSVFGLDMNKQVYVILSWIIILGLSVLVGTFAYLYNNSKRVTDEKIKAFEEITQEFKEHKQNARERETKVKRELQTEANKVEELKQQVALLKKQVSL